MPKFPENGPPPRSQSLIKKAVGAGYLDRARPHSRLFGRTPLRCHTLPVSKTIQASLYNWITSPGHSAVGCPSKPVMLFEPAFQGASRLVVDPVMKLPASHKAPCDVRRLMKRTFGRRMGSEIAGHRD